MPIYSPKRLSWIAFQIQTSFGISRTDFPVGPFKRRTRKYNHDVLSVSYLFNVVSRRRFAVSVDINHRPEEQSRKPKNNASKDSSQ